MVWDKKLKTEIVKLNCRVQELEERLCPCSQHDWELIGRGYDVAYGVGDVEIIYRYKCKRCGKTTSTMEDLAVAAEARAHGMTYGQWVAQRRENHGH